MENLHTRKKDVEIRHVDFFTIEALPAFGVKRKINRAGAS